MNEELSISDTVDELVKQFTEYEVLTESGFNTQAAMVGRLKGLLGVIMCEDDYANVRVRGRLAAMIEQNTTFRNSLKD